MFVFLNDESENCASADLFSIKVDISYLFNGPLLITSMNKKKSIIKLNYLEQQTSKRDKIFYQHKRCSISFFSTDNICLLTQGTYSYRAQYQRFCSAFSFFSSKTYLYHNCHSYLEENTKTNPIETLARPSLSCFSLSATETTEILDISLHHRKTQQTALSFKVRQVFSKSILTCFCFVSNAYAIGTSCTQQARHVCNRPDMYATGTSCT